MALQRLPAHAPNFTTSSRSSLDRTRSTPATPKDTANFLDAFEELSFENLSSEKSSSIKRSKSQPLPSTELSQKFLTNKAKLEGLHTLIKAGINNLAASAAESGEASAAESGKYSVKSLNVFRKTIEDALMDIDMDQLNIGELSTLQNINEELHAFAGEADANKLIPPGAENVVLQIKRAVADVYCKKKIMDKEVKAHAEALVKSLGLTGEDKQEAVNLVMNSCSMVGFNRMYNKENVSGGSPSSDVDFKFIIDDTKIQEGLKGLGVPIDSDYKKTDSKSPLTNFRKNVLKTLVEEKGTMQKNMEIEFEADTNFCCMYASDVLEYAGNPAHPEFGFCATSYPMAAVFCSGGSESSDMLDQIHEKLFDGLYKKEAPDENGRCKLKTDDKGNYILNTDKHGQLTEAAEKRLKALLANNVATNISPKTGKATCSTIMSGQYDYSQRTGGVSVKGKPLFKLAHKGNGVLGAAIYDADKRADMVQAEFAFFDQLNTDTAVTPENKAIMKKIIAEYRLLSSKSKKAPEQESFFEDMANTLTKKAKEFGVKFDLSPDHPVNTNTETVDKLVEELKVNARELSFESEKDKNGAKGFVDEPTGMNVKYFMCRLGDVFGLAGHDLIDTFEDNILDPGKKEDFKDAKKLAKELSEAGVRVQTEATKNRRSGEKAMTHQESDSVYETLSVDEFNNLSKPLKRKMNALFNTLKERFPAEETDSLPELGDEASFIEFSKLCTELSEELTGYFESERETT